MHYIARMRGLKQNRQAVIAIHLAFFLIVTVLAIRGIEHSLASADHPHQIVSLDRIATGAMR